MDEASAQLMVHQHMPENHDDEKIIIDMHALDHHPMSSPGHEDAQSTLLKQPTLFLSDNNEDLPPQDTHIPSHVRKIKGSAIKLFGRLWNCSPEDTAIPNLCEIIPNVAFFGLIVYTFAAHVFQQSIHQNMFEAYAAVSLGVLALALLLNVVTLVQACTTVMFKPNPAVSKLIVMRMVVFMLQLGLAIYGIVKVYFVTDVEPFITVFFHALVIFNWVEVGVALIAPFCLYSFLGHSKFAEEENYQQWSDAFRTAACQFPCCPNGLQMEDDDFLRFGKQMQKFFLDIRGFVVSDIVAGMALLRAFKVANPQFVHNILMRKLIEDNTAQEEFEKHCKDYETTPEDLPLLVREAAGHIGHVVGAYGAGLYSLMRPWECLFLCCTCPLQHCLNCTPTNVDGKDCLNRGRNAYLRRAEIPHEDLIWADLNSDFLNVVYFVAINHHKKEIVINARGSFSLADVVTDLDAESIDLTAYGFPGHHAHRGIFLSALRLRDKLKSSSQFQQCVQNHSDYVLVLAGHSLGASVCALLALLIENDYFKVRCFAFACPAVLDRTLATAPSTKRLIKTFVYSQDWVPRLSFNSIRVAKTQILSLLQSYASFHEQHPEMPPARKWKIMLLLCSIVESEKDDADIDLNSLPALMRQFVQDPSVKKQLEEAVISVEESERRLFVPGEVFFVEKITTAERCCGCCVAGFVKVKQDEEHGFGTKVRHSSCDEFLEVNISPGIIHEHFPQEYYAAMRNALIVET